MIVPIVEGHAEVQSIRSIIERTALGCGLGWPSVGKPIRVKRYGIVQQGRLEAAIELAIRQRSGVTAVLLILDADESCPAELGPELAARGSAAAGNRVAFGVVLAKWELEAWFLADVPSLADPVEGVPLIDSPEDPETHRDAKGALERLLGKPYSSVIDQPSFAARFNVAAASERCRSFRKLEKEIKAALEA